VEIEHWKCSQLLRAKQVKHNESFQESEMTFSDHDQETPQESNAVLSEDEICFSFDNETPETLEPKNGART